MIFIIVLSSIGQLGSSLSLSWAHSSISCQLQFGVSQLSAGFGWPQPGQLGQPGSGQHVSHPSRLAWPCFHGNCREGRGEAKGGKDFLKCLGLLLVSSCPKWMTNESWSLSLGMRQTIIPLTRGGYCTVMRRSTWMAEAGKKCVFCSQSTTVTLSKLPSPTPTHILSIPTKPWCPTMKTCLW